MISLLSNAVTDQKALQIADKGKSERLKGFRTKWHDLILIYIPLFGFRVRTHGNKIFTRYGAILDDIERTCRYWVADGGIVRFPAYQVQKRDKPGAYGETKAGISACYDNRDV